MEGFIPKEKKLVKKKKNTKKIIGCETCGAYKLCENGKLNYFGNGDKEILVVGDIATKREDLNGKAFTDISSTYLKKELLKIGINLEQDCYYINAIQCYAPKRTNLMWEGCRRRLDIAIRKLKPKKILLLGDTAIEMFLQERIQKSRLGKGNIERWMGKAIPDQEYGCWVVCNYHPKFILNALVERKNLMKKYGSFREQKRLQIWEHPQLIKDDNYRIRSLYFKKYLKVILNETEFKKVDYRKHCEYIDNVEEAIGVMRTLMKEPMLSMDYETNCLMPYKSNSKVLCVSFATHEYSWSFPIFKDNKRFMRIFKRLLTDEEIKIVIANFQFEDTWTRAKFGFSITNCYWDTVLAAHMIHPTVNKNTSLKVNAYIVDGALAYDAEVEPYISGRNDNDPYSLNRLEELPAKNTGLYNAEDSLHTQNVALYQMSIIENDEKLNRIFRLYMRAQEMYSEISFYGTPIDMEQLTKNEIKLDKILNTLMYKMQNSEEIKKWYNVHPNKDFNFNSNEQLSELFFDILGYSTNKKTDSGNMSVDKDVIEELSSHSELAVHLSEYKKVFKLKNTDLAGIKRATYNGRIHPNIGVATASTGRSNSYTPNLQNLAGYEMALQMIKSCFIAEKGQEFIAYDYKSLEVHSSVGISKDAMMIKELMDPKSEDSHTLMTQQFFGEDLQEAAKFILENRDGHTNHSEEDIKHFIKSEMRQHVKSANFALQYGGSAYRVYITLFVEKFKSHHLSWFHHKGYDTDKKIISLCKNVYDYYWERYEMLKKYVDKTWEEYLSKGYFYSKFGFRYDGINTKTFIGNCDSQGSGFVLALLGNLKLWETMKEKYYKSSIKLTVHDSTEFSVEPEEFFEDDLEKDIEYSMVDYVHKKVRWLELPLKIDPEYYNKNWGVECKRELLENKYYENVP